jgi:hypothetical protein
MDSEIAVGDVVLDLVQGALMQVLSHEGTVEGHAEREGYNLAEYACHPLFGVEQDEPAWKCVYLKASLKSLPDASYDFPDSRLARVPVEEANEDLRRVQKTVVQEMVDEAQAEVIEDSDERVDR